MKWNDDNNQIGCGGLGAHDFWDKNIAKAKRDGLESCAHCGKGMVDGTGFIAVYFWENDSFYPLTMKDEVLAAGGEIVRVGPTCAKQFVYKNDVQTYFEKP